MKLKSGQDRAVNQFTFARLRGLFHAAGLTCAIVMGAISLLAVSTVNATEQNARTLMLYGDSLMAGYGLDHEDGFAPRLEAALKQAGHDVTVVNSSVSGDTTAAGLARLDWALVETPDVVLLELGANDALRGMEPSQTRENLAEIIAKLRDRDVEVLLAGMMAPPNMGSQYGEEFNTIYPELAKQYDVDFYPFFLDGVAAEPALNQEDGMHPNADGVKVIVERILPSVVRMLDPSTPS